MMLSLVGTALLFLICAPLAVAAPWIGLYVPGAPSNMAPVQDAAQELNAPVALINFFVADSEGFPTARCQNALDASSTPMITLEMWSTKNGGLSAITNGSEDAYLRSFAASARSLGRTVWLRPLHEMNGSWYPWGATSANSPAQFIAAWRHIHNMFVAQGATNVRFVWCPNVDFAVAPYYPGDAYVDYAAIDGYNNGAPWRSFAGLFGATYAQVAEVTSKPIFIGETGSIEGDPGKAAWISAMFAAIPAQFPRIEGICWFDADQSYDWRFDSTQASLQAMRSGVSTATVVAPQVKAAQPAPAVTIRLNRSTIRHGRALTVRGESSPTLSGESVRITVNGPKGRKAVRSAKVSSAGKWSIRYTPRVRGRYSLKASIQPSEAGEGVSRTVALLAR